MKVRVKLIDGGGVGAGLYGQGCTHVIVNKIAYVSIHFNFTQLTQWPIFFSKFFNIQKQNAENPAFEC